MLRQRKVLLIDIDAQGHCSSALHAELRGVSHDTLTSVLLGKRRDVQEIVVPSRVEGLWATSADKDLGVTEGVMAGRIGKEFLLKRAMSIARTHYDTIVIDCPPNLGTLTVNAIMAADWVLIPCDMSVLALEGVDDIFETLETISDTLGHNVGVLGVLRTRYDSRNQRVNVAVESGLDERYARFLLDTRIPVNTTLSQAQVVGTPVFKFDASCRGSQAYGELIEEISGRLGV